MTAPAPPEHPRWFAVGAVAALTIATIFALVGDGVEVRGDHPLTALVLDRFHTLAWVLLAVAFGLAALVGRWTRASGWVALGGLACYVVFVVVLLASD